MLYVYVRCSVCYMRTCICHMYMLDVLYIICVSVCICAQRAFVYMHMYVYMYMLYTSYVCDRSAATRYMCVCMYTCTYVTRWRISRLLASADNVCSRMLTYARVCNIHMQAALDAMTSLISRMLAPASGAAGQSGLTDVAQRGGWDVVVGWVRHVLPMVRDREPTVADRAVEAVALLLLAPMADGSARGAGMHTYAHVCCRMLT